MTKPVPPRNSEERARVQRPSAEAVSESGSAATTAARAEERVPIRRAILWSVVATILAAGIVLYFLYGRSIAPLFTPGG